MVIISYLSYGLAVLVYLRPGEDRLQQIAVEKVGLATAYGFLWLSC